jgi:hypothetical protein
MVRLNLSSVQLGLGLVVAVGVCSTLGGVAGCNTQSLVPIDGGPARSGTGGGSGNRSGSAGGGIGIGTTGAGGAGGDGGDIPTGFGGDVGAGGVMGTSGAGGITGAAGFGRPFGGAAGHGVGLGGGAGNGGSPVDASTTTSPQDAGDCQCVLGADGVLRMSWDCFTTYFGGGAAMSGWCGGPGGWITSCGLDVFKLDRDNAAIPDDEWAYDPSGNLVGQQIAETSPVFVCPTAPTLWPAATVVAAGQFPASGCAVSDCTCGDAGAVSCPVPDAGTTPINPF